jgi:hypothetical protein
MFPEEIRAESIGDGGFWHEPDAVWLHRTKLTAIRQRCASRTPPHF